MVRLAEHILTVIGPEVPKVLPGVHTALRRHFGIDKPVVEAGGHPDNYNPSGSPASVEELHGMARSYLDGE